MDQWDDLNAQFVTTLREQRIEPVPPQIVRMAQKSYDGVAPDPNVPDDKLHAMQFTFDTEAKAAAFARHMSNAGLHTVPQSSITVVIDPERTKVPKVAEDGTEVKNDKGKVVMVPGPPVNPCKVAWRAGARRGRNAS